MASDTSNIQCPFKQMFETLDLQLIKLQYHKNKMRKALQKQ